MNDQKTEQVNLRMSPKAKALLKEASGLEHRSVSNMVEHLVFTYCADKGIEAPPVTITESTKSKKGD